MALRRCRVNMMPSTCARAGWTQVGSGVLALQCSVHVRHPGTRSSIRNCICKSTTSTLDRWCMEKMVRYL